MHLNAPKSSFRMTNLIHDPASYASASNDPALSALALHVPCLGCSGCACSHVPCNACFASYDPATNAPVLHVSCIACSCFTCTCFIYSCFATPASHAIVLHDSLPRMFLLLLLLLYMVLLDTLLLRMFSHAHIHAHALAYHAPSFCMFIGLQVPTWHTLWVLSQA